MPSLDDADFIKRIDGADPARPASLPTTTTICAKAALSIPKRYQR